MTAPRTPGDGGPNRILSAILSRGGLLVVGIVLAGFALYCGYTTTGETTGEREITQGWIMAGAIIGIVVLFLVVLPALRKRREPNPDPMPTPRVGETAAEFVVRMREWETRHRKPPAPGPMGQESAAHYHERVTTWRQDLEQ